MNDELPALEEQALHEVHAVDYRRPVLVDLVEYPNILTLERHVALGREVLNRMVVRLPPRLSVLQNSKVDGTTDALTLLAHLFEVLLYLSHMDLISLGDSVDEKAFECPSETLTGFPDVYLPVQVLFDNLAKSVMPSFFFD